MSAYAALAEPHRRQILDLLRDGERPAGDLVERLDLSGKRRLYALRPAPLAEVDEWLEPYRVFWSSSLDTLERHLDENP
jgi:DNA-binding transcriptional ArsR family regulator